MSESGYYAYAGDAPLGKEPLDSGGRFIWTGITQRTARLRARKIFTGPYRLYQFQNWYRDETFTEVRP